MIIKPKNNIYVLHVSFAANFTLGIFWVYYRCKLGLFLLKLTKLKEYHFCTNSKK